ncbi:hypothetical protein GGS24DRAFT_501338 [Hypoxylon argillaceum]|nr:hypothetical protein GGS24DRAFT_501338 [Hypoxylon argillaceum]
MVAVPVVGGRGAENERGRNAECVIQTGFEEQKPTDRTCEGSSSERSASEETISRGNEPKDSPSEYTTLPESKLEDNQLETVKPGQDTPRETVVIIGLFSFLGYATAVQAIDSGYQVRAVFSTVQLGDMKDFLSTFPERCIDHIRFAVIGKLVVKELVEHFKGASCIYVASLFLPIPICTTPKLIKANVWILCEIIEAATLCRHIKRIVFTSSITAYFKPEELDDWVGTKEIFGEYAPVYIDSYRELSHRWNPEMATYIGSRTTDLILAEIAIALDGSLHFDLVCIMVTNVFGPDRMKTTLEGFNQGSNAKLLNHILGKGRERLLGVSVHIDDVARCHVEALSPKVPRGRYILTGGSTNWFDAMLIVKEHYPKLICSVFTTEDVPTRITPCTIGNRRTRMVFGNTFKAFEEQVKDTVDFYLHLQEKNPPTYLARLQDINSVLAKLYI